MPYVNLDSKDRIADGRKALTVGELTYQLQQAIEEWLLAQDTVRYEQLALALGAIEGCKSDFIARVVVPYEQRMRHLNGDCWSPKLVK